MPVSFPVDLLIWQQIEPQPNRCQYSLITYLELEQEEEDVVDGPVIATENNCQLESSPLDSPQPGCLDTSTLRLLPRYLV